MGKLECDAPNNTSITAPATPERTHRPKETQAVTTNSMDIGLPNTQEPPAPGNQEITIATLNTRTLSTYEREIELEQALQEIKVDILGLSEIRKSGEDIIERTNGDIWYHLGTTPGQKGVGFIIKKQVKHLIHNIVGVSERIAVLVIKEKRQKITIIQAYAPTSASSDNEIEEFYDLLETTIDKYRSPIIIVVGDFNSKIGWRDTGEEETIGAHGYGTRNDRGTRLIQFAQAQELKVLNTYFKKQPQKRWTWRSPDGKTFNEVDFILGNTLRVIKDINVVQKLKFDTDHRMVRAVLKIPRGNPYQSKSAKPPLEALDKETFLTQLQEQMLKKPINSEWETMELYKAIEQSILLASNEATSNENTKKSKHKLQETTIALINERERLRQRGLNSAEEQAEYREIDKLTKRAIRSDVREHRTNMTRQILESTKSTRKVRRNITSGKQWMLGAKKTSGERMTARPDIIAEATNYYKQLYTSRIPPSKLPEKTQDDTKTIPPILQSEVRTAIKELKYRKTPGEDGIWNEYLKYGEEILTRPITILFNKILEEETIPEQWTTSTIILLHKKGPKDNLNNYRPISLMSNLYKLFSKVITRRLTKPLDENQPNEQAGFRSGFSTADHLQAVNQIMEKFNEFNLPLYIAFVDYTKAFDSVEHSSVLQALEKQGIESKYIRILDNLYIQSKAKVKTEREGQIFRLGRGVKQGDPISPKLFTSVLEEVFRKLKWDNKHGIIINGRRLTNLRFADDVTLFARSPNELQQMITELNDRSNQVGLAINYNKTKVMTNRTPTPISIHATDIEYVNDYTYLGQTVSLQQGTEKEVQRRITQSWKAFWALKFIFLDKSLNRRLRIEALSSCVFPVLTYGCQTWALTERQRRSIEICQRKMERKIIGVSLRDKISNIALQKITATKNIAQKALQTKWTWGGHVARQQQGRWAREITMWDPYIGKRTQGRPRRRWADTFKQKLGGHWSTIARNRNKWKLLVNNLKVD